MAVGVTGFSPVPKTRSVATLLNGILAFVKMPQDSDTKLVALDAVAAGVRHHNTRPWRWSSSYDDIATKLSTFDYSLPRDMNTPLHLERLNSNSRPDGHIPYKDPQSFLKDYDRSTADGTPSVYTIIDYHTNGQLTLDTAPNSSFVTDYPTLRFYYLRNVVPPAVDSEHIDAPASVEHFLEWYAKWELAVMYNPAVAVAAERQWVRAWAELVRMDTAEVDWA